VRGWIRMEQIGAGYVYSTNRKLQVSSNLGLESPQ
jgi:hypothetical protein